MSKEFELLDRYGSSVQLKVYGRIKSLWAASALFNPNDFSVTQGELSGSLRVLSSGMEVGFYFVFNDKAEGINTLRKFRKAFINGDYVMLTGDVENLTDPYLRCPGYQLIDVATSKKPDRKVSIVFTGVVQGEQGRQIEVACVEIIENKWIGEAFQQIFRLNQEGDLLNNESCPDLIQFISDSPLIVQDQSNLVLGKCLSHEPNHLTLDLKELIASFSGLEDASIANAYRYFEVDKKQLISDGALLAKAELNARLYIAMALVAR